MNSYKAGAGRQFSFRNLETYPKPEWSPASARSLFENTDSWVPTRERTKLESEGMRTGHAHLSMIDWSSALELELLGEI